ncbi:MAG TPA: hypothetical protein VK179_10730 [Bacteroidales bacterium]|nr:hypothetical protein [Bacteroidales bacterium]
MITIFMTKKDSHDVLEIKDIHPLATERDQWYGTNHQTFFFRREDKNLGYCDQKKVKSFKTDLKSEALLCASNFKRTYRYTIIVKRHKGYEQDLKQKKGL